MVHKLLTNNRNVQDLPIRPIIAITKTSTYQLAKYLAKLLSPLSVSEYTVKSTKDFVNKIRKEKFPPGYTLVSFDVKS